jgi:hypothetical protein
MKAGERGIAKKTEGGQTIRMTVKVVCTDCSNEYVIDSRVPMRDQEKCEDCR